MAKTDNLPARLNFTEDNAKAAILEARGDLFFASQMLGVTAIRLQRAIQVSQILQACLETVKAVGKGVSREEIEKLIEERVALYRASGLDALHDLATMPISKNSAQNQVKLAAAARLAGSQEHSASGDGMADTLRELNQSYQENAPRLRVTRERLTIETVPADRVVNEAKPQ